MVNCEYWGLFVLVNLPIYQQELYLLRIFVLSIILQKVRKEKLTIQHNALSYFAGK